jgi:hypothetical protein
MEESFPILIFLLITVGVSLLLHCFIPRIIYASVLSAIVANFIVQIIDFIDMGCLDPFFIIALVFGSLISFIISLIVGLPFVYVRYTDGRKSYAIWSLILFIIGTVFVLLELRGNIETFLMPLLMFIASAVLYVLSIFRKHKSDEQ